MSTMQSDWLTDNLANWDERVGVHLAAPVYDLAELRAGRGKLNTIEEQEIGDVAGKRVLHLQCHFGKDTLTLAQRGAAGIFCAVFSARGIGAGRRARLCRPGRAVEKHAPARVHASAG